jgi:hypothetical protein
MQLRQGFWQVVEFRTGLRVAVRRVEGRDQHAAHRGFDVAALRVGRFARQLGARDDRRRAVGENRDPVPTLLTFPHRLVTGPADCIGGELGVRGLQLLQADDIGLRPA